MFWEKNYFVFFEKPLTKLTKIDEPESKIKCKFEDPKISGKSCRFRDFGLLYIRHFVIISFILFENLNLTFLKIDNLNFFRYPKTKFFTLSLNSFILFSNNSCRKPVRAFSDYNRIKNSIATTLKNILTNVSWTFSTFRWSK